MIKILLKKSFFYKIYLFLKYPKLITFKKNQFRFISTIIPKGSICFDIGANTGSVINLLLRRNATVVALEPDESNYKFLLSKFKQNKRVLLIKKAVDFEVSQKEFYIIENNSAFNTLSQKWKTVLEDTSKNRWGEKRVSKESIIVETTTLDLLIQKYGAPYYIKIDVEGFELNAIQGLSFPVPLISLEANLPEFKKETLKCIDLIFEINTKYLFNISVDDSISFYFKTWVSKKDITVFISETKIKYLELYCKLDYP